MKRLLKSLTWSLAALTAAAWLTRLGMQSIIPLPVSDSMLEWALVFYRAQDQEEVTDLLAVLGLLVWTPVVALLLWGLLRVRHARCRGSASS
ncbi:hypothetical protein [Variovorax sp. OV329]|uniref:hypothetical protein n=1 Tax=Variovorax sp. OV329 TaxID=1882825 RepID=UPI001113BCC4|nr:hypothetical protein [Variovorax sp. OV329]